MSWIQQDTCDMTMDACKRIAAELRAKGRTVRIDRRPPEVRWIDGVRMVVPFGKVFVMEEDDQMTRLTRLHSVSKALADGTPIPGGYFNECCGAPKDMGHMDGCPNNFKERAFLLRQKGGQADAGE